MDRTERPDISFVVIAYNEADKIDRCLSAILSQEGLGCFEIVVVDDGSSDGTSLVVGDFSAGCPQVRLISERANRGRGHARSTGISHARGELIAMVDADIVIPPQWLIRCRNELRYSDAVAGIAVPDGDVSYLANRFSLHPRVHRPTLTISGSNTLCRRRVFDEVSVDPQLREGEDIALVKAMEAAGIRTSLLDDLVVEHKESKNFVQSMKWYFRSGVGAARQFHAYRQVRVADLAFALQLMAAVAGMACLVRKQSWVSAVALPVLSGTATAAAHVFDRFELGRSGLGTAVGAVATDLVLSQAYFVGRTVGHANRLTSR